MQERKQGCICELDTETGEPLVANYAECPVHKPDAISPKDTASNLYDKYYDICSDIGELKSDHQNQDAAQECATICVDEILSVLDTFQTHAYAKVLIPYYNEVKKEIQNL